MATKTAGRFVSGDVVVLNGHRAIILRSVTGGNGREWVSFVFKGGETVPAFPADMLPDPAPRETPEVAAAREALAAALEPLARYEAEHGQPGEWPCLAPGLDALSGLRDSLDGGGERGTAPGEAGTEGARTSSGPATPAPALTPGMTVADRNGRLGLVTEARRKDAGAVWVYYFGDNHPRFLHRDDLRPVTLVEKPEVDATSAALHAIRCDAEHHAPGQGSLCDSLAARETLHALFPGSPS